MNRSWFSGVFSLCIGACSDTSRQRGGATGNQQQRTQSQPYNNARLARRALRKEEYTSIKGRETGVLVQTYGETWRQLKNGWITPIVGWLFAAVVLIIARSTSGAGASRSTGRRPAADTALHAVRALLALGRRDQLQHSGRDRAIIMLGKYVLLPVIGYTLFAWLTQLSKHLHNFAGPVFVVSLLMFIVMFVKDNLPRLYDIAGS